MRWTALKLEKLKNYLWMKNNSFVSHYTKCHEQQKWTLKTFLTNKSSKSTIVIRFSLLQFFPFVYFLCHLFLILISWAIYFFYLVAVLTVWILVNFVDYEQSLFFLGPSSKTPETRKWVRAWLKARDRRSRFSRLAASPLNARSCVYFPY